MFVTRLWHYLQTIWMRRWDALSLNKLQQWIHLGRCQRKMPNNLLLFFCPNHKYWSSISFGWQPVGHFTLYLFQYLDSSQYHLLLPTALLLSEGRFLGIFQQLHQVNPLSSWAKLGCHQFFWIKFYWNPAMLTHSHIVFDCLYATKQSRVFVTETMWPSKLKCLLSG